MQNNQQSQQNSPPKIKLYIYGNRQSDQYWLPDDRSYSRRPYCLSDIKQMTTQQDIDQQQAQQQKQKGQGNNNDDDNDNKSQNKIIMNPLYNKEIYKIACGGLHSVVLTTQGQVYTFGCNDQGALGRKGIESIPAKVKLQDPVDMISAGDNHSMFANSKNGAIYFTGNYNYKRGQKMTESIFQPIKTFTAEINIKLKNKPIQKIVSGENHSCVLVNGHVFCRGQPQSFTIGRRISARHKVQNSLTFNGVNLSDITDIECGGYHTIVKVEKGKKKQYYAWGKNDKGQLGIGSYDDQNYPIQIEKLNGKDIVHMSAGTSFSLFLDSQGQLYGCGSNDYGNLGLGQNYTYEPTQDQAQKEIDNENEKIQKKESQKMPEKIQGSSQQNGVKLGMKIDIQKKNSKKSVKSTENKLMGNENNSGVMKCQKNDEMVPIPTNPIQINKISQQKPNVTKSNNQLTINNSNNNKQSQQKPDQGKMINERPNQPQAIQNSQVRANNDMIKQFVRLRLDGNSQLNKQEQEKLQKAQQQLYNKKIANTYIKKVRKIETPELLDKIVSGSQFSIGWNKEHMYTWGMGIGYVLLNGEEQDQYKPFQVKSKIINNHRIYDVAAGGQHVLYLSYPDPEGQKDMTIQPSAKVWEELSAYKKLPRKRI